MSEQTYSGRIRLGAQVVDLITGFKGVVASVNFHLTGCTQYWVEAPAKDDGAKGECEWIDESRLETEGMEVVKLVDTPTWFALPKAAATTGPAKCAAPNVGPSKP